MRPRLLLAWAILLGLGGVLVVVTDGGDADRDRQAAAPAATTTEPATAPSRTELRPTSTTTGRRQSSPATPTTASAAPAPTGPAPDGDADVAASAPTPGALRAGAAKVPATWHVGASAGQYATDGLPFHDRNDGDGTTIDPSLHSTRRAPGYGIESRSYVRALFVEDAASGGRFAVVTGDLYIPQDLLATRVAQLLVAHDADVAAGRAPGPATGIDEDHLVMSVTHSHTAPYYSTPSPGVFAFQDVFDVRFFEFMARAMADAVIEASATRVPVRLGGATSTLTALHRHSFGPAVADDGTPAGYPYEDILGQVQVLRLDDISDPEAPAPLANWVVYGGHPEFLDGNDLHSGEYVGAMQRIVEREIGGVVVFSQNDTGTAEPATGARAHPPSARAEYSHREYAQMERAARLFADVVEDTSADIERGTPERPDSWSAFTTSAPVSVLSLRFAPPSLRLLPTVSSCRVERAFGGDPPLPLVGLPDCFFPLDEIGVGALPADLRVTDDALRDAGIPVPDNLGAPSWVALQETIQVHLMAMRIGDIGITVCPCEQWKDQSRNIASRLDRVEGNLWLGFDWTTQTTPSGREWCVAGGDGMWTCADPRTRGATDLDPVPERAIRRMQAQVRNDAAGWDLVANALAAESEPTDPGAVWGNYTHEELTPWGYGMVVTVGMSNDYWGYIATYREFQRGDHYRKALTALGPHASDFLATRLSRMAACLNGWDGPAAPATPLDGGIGSCRLLAPKDVLYGIERERQRLVATAIGELATAYVPLYAATLPADAGEPAITTQPSGIRRFDAARLAWVGGSNWFDLPDVRVERDVDGQWVPYGDLDAEVAARVHFPRADELPGWRAGTHAWRWEATFEAFGSDVTLPDATGTRRTATPRGTYRFVIDGRRHTGGGAVEPYHLESAPFAVAPWDGLVVRDLRVDGGEASFVVEPIDYPDTYDSPFPFIRGRDAEDRQAYADGSVELFCFHCSFEPWADTGAVVSARITVERSGGGRTTLPASLGADGRWRATGVRPGDGVRVEVGDVVDAFGQTTASAVTAA